MKMPDFPPEAILEDVPKLEHSNVGLSKRIENLLEKIPKEIRPRWEKEIEDKDYKKAVSILEKVIQSRARILGEGEAEDMNRERSPLENEIEKAAEEIFQLNEKSNVELLGRGKHAKVVSYLEKVCIKFLFSRPEEMLQRKAMKSESNYLNKMYKFSVDGVRAPKIYTRGLRKPPFYIAMETIQGKSLKAIIENKEASADFISLIKRQNMEEVILRIEGFLKQMHIQKEITHNDIHEGNIMIDKNGDWYVIDFGSAEEILLDDTTESKKEKDVMRAREAIVNLYRSIKNF
jgi:tRNA A-37 threonylcarbamoyl transferase component Bud32